MIPATIPNEVGLRLAGKKIWKAFTDEVCESLAAINRSMHSPALYTEMPNNYTLRILESSAEVRLVGILEYDYSGFAVTISDEIAHSRSSIFFEIDSERVTFPGTIRNAVLNLMHDLLHTPKGKQKAAM